MGQIPAPVHDISKACKIRNFVRHARKQYLVFCVGVVFGIPLIGFAVSRNARLIYR